MSGRTRTPAIWLPLAVLVVASVLLVAAATGCGGDGGDGSESPSSSARPPSSATGEPDFTSPSASPSPTGVTRIDVEGDLLVARGEKDDWAVWRVTPATGAEKRLAGLPFEPITVAASPDRGSFAYLTSSAGWRRTLAILDVGTGDVTWSTFEGTGLRRVDDMTWLSPSELLVSGPVPKGNGSPEDDRLYVYDTATKEWSPFHDLGGADPSAAPAAGTVAFRRLVTLEQTESGPRVREDLQLVDPVTGGVSTIRSSDYIIYAAGNLYEQPVLSPDGCCVLAAATGSDTGVTWILYRADDGERLWKREQSMAYPLIGAWDEDGRRLAFWGVPATGWPKTTVWVYDVQADRFVKSLTKRGERVLDGLVTGLDWSRRGDLVASTSEGATDIVFIAPGGDPRAFVAVCSGSLPVWLE